MKVEDVMSTDVVTVEPGTPLKEVARILAERRISGLPVVTAEGVVVGVVSEADILVKERGPVADHTGALGWLFDARGAGDALKSQARAAGEAMTTPAITIAPYRPVAAAAQMMLEHGVNRLPVVRNDRLVGIVTRADLVRAFARSDRELAVEVREQVEYVVALGDDNGAFSGIDVSVQNGEVRLSGKVRRRSTAELLPAHLAKIAGVVAVASDVDWREDDTKPPRAP